MPHWQKRLIPAAVILLAVGTWSLLRPTPDTTLIGADIKGYRIAFNGTATGAAHVSVPFARKDGTYTVANVAIDLNKDGKFAPYTTVGGTQDEWVVKNSRAKVFEGGNTFSFDILDADVATRDNFKLVAMLTALPVGDWSGKPHGKSAAAEIVLTTFGAEDYGPLYSPDPKGVKDGAGGDAPTPGKPASTKTKFPDAEKYLRDTTAPEVEGAGEAAAAIGAEAPTPIPAAGSDFEVFQPGVPDMVQGRNECAPTSASNGMHWLARRYGFEDRMPATQRDSMNELKTDMRWDEGVATREDFIPGKVAYSRRHGLPIVTHQIGGELDTDITRKIAAELARGQAVEVVIGYYTQDAAGTWTRHGGHVMSAVGAFGSNGDEFLGLHDPVSPEAGRLDMYEIDGNRMLNYRYRGNNKVFIDRAFAQSPTAEWVAQHPPSISLDTAGLVEAANLRDTMIVDAIQIGANWYPARQFHSGTGPECDNQEHWHANTGTAWGVDRAGFQPFELNNAERVYRARREIVRWQDPDGCGAGKTAEVARSAVLISNAEAGRLVAETVR